MKEDCAIQHERLSSFLFHCIVSVLLELIMFHVDMYSVVYCIKETVWVDYLFMLFVEDGVKRQMYHSITRRFGDQ
jgi:hypothetical protein